MNHFGKYSSCGSDLNKTWRNASEQERTAEVQKRKLFEAQYGSELKTERMKTTIISIIISTLLSSALWFLMYSTVSTSHSLIYAVSTLFIIFFIGAYGGYVIGSLKKSKKEENLWSQFEQTLPPA